MSDVCFIAVSYFGSADLSNYMASLHAQTDGRWQLRIVDNSQDDAEFSKLKSIAGKDRRVEVWKTESNLGYFGAAEWARARLDTNSYSWIAVTNTDVVLDSPDFLASLASFTQNRVGVVAPAIYGSSSRSALNPYMHARPTLRKSQLRQLMLNNVAFAQATVVLSHFKRRGAKGRSVPEAETDIYAAHGCFMLFGVAFFEAGGTFIHDSFLFGEEITIAEFSRHHNLRTVFVPNLTVKHTEHASTGILRSRLVLKSQVLAARNVTRLIAKGDTGSSTSQ